MGVFGWRVRKLLEFRFFFSIVIPGHGIFRSDRTREAHALYICHHPGHRHSGRAVRPQDQHARRRHLPAGRHGHRSGNARAHQHPRRFGAQPDHPDLWRQLHPLRWRRLAAPVSPQGGVDHHRHPGHGRRPDHGRCYGGCGLLRVLAASDHRTSARPDHRLDRPRHAGAGLQAGQDPRPCRPNRHVGVGVQ